MTIEAKNRRWIYVMEAKSAGQPRVVRNGLLRIRSFLARTKHKNRYGIFVAAFIAAESARLCIDSGMGHVDAACNA